VRNFSTLLLLFAVLTGCSRPMETSEPAILTGARTVLLASGGRFLFPKWSPDGKKILVEHFEQWEYLEIRDTSGKLLESQKLDRVAGPPQWMGTQAVNREPPQTGERKRTIFRAFGQKSALLTFEGTAHVTWSRDGNLAAVALSPAYTLKGQEQKPTEVYLFNSANEELRFLWTAGSTALSTYMSPSGRYVAVDYRDGESAWVVAIIEVETGRSRELWRVPWPGRAIGNLTWSPDEAFIGARFSASQSEAGFYLLDSKGRFPPVRISTLDLVFPDWSPTGDQIVYTTVGYPGENELRMLNLPTNWREQVVKLQQEQESEQADQ